uniref:Odorant receptor n=1 Tax=Semiothisa cinerearia TaxID=2249628 RepID=A0A889XL71_9NEOP|nr:odorant receptor [Semiothisa cinerearia]
MGNAQFIHDILSKRNYDFGRTDVTLKNFHPQIYMTLATEGVFFVKRDSYLRFCIPFYNIAMTIIGVTFEGLNVYMGMNTGDYSVVWESVCYVSIISSTITVYAGLLLNREKIWSQIEEMERDFEEICNLGPRYRDPFMEGQLLVWKLFCGWSIFVITICSSFFIYPCILLVYQSLKPSEEYKNRPLVFPLWLPNDDPYRTPNYEIFFVVEVFFVIAFTLCFGGYVYTLFHFLLHYYTKMDMIILDFQVIFDGLDESVVKLPKTDPRRISVQMTLNKRLKRIVTWHLSIFRAIHTAASVFRPTLIYQVMCSAVILCLIFNQIVMKLDRGEFDVVFTLLGAGAVLQLWIPCYLGTILRNKGFAVGDACWNCGWHETSLGLLIRIDILVVLMRAQMPIFIKYTGQPVVQLETFSAIMSTSYSYFNMLRQSQK